MQLDSFKNENFLNTAPSLQSLEEWLVYLESLDPNNIELGLERVKKVFDALFLKSLEKCSIVEIAGTNGKGSTAAVIAATLDQSGIKYGLYTSPHVLDFRERIVINGQKVDTALLLEAFAKVKDCMERTHSPLTYFEFTTLAAFFCFKKSHVDALVLEIGLGGRLDAVNILKANIAVITSIDYDHMQYLGNTLLEIANEKAGIIKEDSQVVVGRVDEKVLSFLREKAKTLHCSFYAFDYDFGVSTENGFVYFANSSASNINFHFTKPKVHENDAGIAIKVLHLLRDRGFRIRDSVIASVLTEVSLLGRGQCIKQHPRVCVDVAHNPEAISYLVRRLQETLCKGSRFLVLGMLKDKDVESVATLLKDSFSSFYLCSLKGPRGEGKERLQKAFSNLGKGAMCRTFDSVEQALKSVLAEAEGDDEVIITGSFVTVANALSFLNEKYGENNDRTK